METEIEKSGIVNKPKRVVRNGFITTLLMITGAVIISKSNIEGMKGGYALILLFGFLAIVSLVIALMYIPRAKEFTRLIKNINPLAHWKYNEEEWQAFVETDLNKTKSDNKATLRLMIIISIVIGAILYWLYKDSDFIVIIGCLLLFLTIVGFSTPYIKKFLLKKGKHEAIICKESIFIGGTFQTWKHTGNRLKNVAISTKGTISILEFRMDLPTQWGYQQSFVRVPIPEGKMDEANRIVEIFQQNLYTGKKHILVKKAEN